ncbi:hypothetical protein [Tunturiibacter gelidiferens]|uniref:hypothetical protein n=1 Tax=Tunturiibacter gelidiferens TaxID=3069689 RepID=UPI003D9AD62D
MKVSIWSWVHKVDGVGDAVFYGELDGIEVVAQGFTEGEGIFLYALEELLVVLGGSRT